MSKKRSGRISPQRTCVICRRTMDKRQLTRLVATSDEGVVVDPTGKRNGRGAYLCEQAECREKAFQTDLLGRALKVNFTDEDRERLRAAMSQAQHSC